jgi:hypothetical protein
MWNNKNLAIDLAPACGSCGISLLLEQLLHALRTQLTTALKSGKIALDFLYF